MDCERVRAQLTAYLDGDLDGDGGTVVRGHLRTCEACRGVATDEAALRDGLRALPPVDPPSSLWDGVQARLAAAEVHESQRPAWRRALGRWRRSIAAPRFVMAGALAAAATIVLVIWKTRPAETPNVADIDPSHDRVIVNPAPKIAPDTGDKPTCKPAITDAGDVTDDLTRDATRVASAYDCAIEELLGEAKPMRATWNDRERTEFDDNVKKLRDSIAKADGKPRDRASRALVTYLQQAVTREDVLLAGVP